LSRRTAIALRPIGIRRANPPAIRSHTAISRRRR
jgi:hypothetical protein